MTKHTILPTGTCSTPAKVLEPIWLATMLKKGDSIYHSGRGTEYTILHRTMIKKEGGWEYGWAYQETPDSEVFTRADALFDEDWFKVI